ncbi:MAG: hypothetical protein ACXVQR_04195 [Solirubrobacteraceae bacterium]
MPQRKTTTNRVALGKELVALRQAGKTWTEIKAATGVDPARGAFLVRWAQVKPRDRITGDLGPAAVKLRDEAGLPWAEIGGRGGVSIAAVKKAYAAAGGTRQDEERARGTAGQAAGQRHEADDAFQGVSEGFFCKNWSAIGPQSEGVVDQFRLALAGHVVGVDMCRADVLVAHRRTRPFRARLGSDHRGRTGRRRSWRADVLARGPESRRIAFEIQLAPMTAAVGRERVADYDADGMESFWTDHTSAVNRWSRDGRIERWPAIVRWSRGQSIAGFPAGRSAVGGFASPVSARAVRSAAIWRTRSRCVLGSRVPVESAAACRASAAARSRSCCCAFIAARVRCEFMRCSPSICAVRPMRPAANNLWAPLAAFHVI